MTETVKKTDGGIRLLGQRFSYPSTLWGTLGVIAVVVGICFIVYTIAVWAHRENLDALVGFKTGSVTAPGKIEVSEGTYHIQFWTPSVATARTRDIAAWEKAASEEKLNDFADKLLKDRRVRGYRRYEVTGQGIASRKQGMWWVMSVSSDYTLEEFATAYHDHWQNDTPGYVEVFKGSPGRYVK